MPEPPCPDLFVNLNAAIFPTLASGPGVRAALFLQGCSLACNGCHNLDAQPFTPRLVTTVNAILAWLSKKRDLRGVTLSGGEPFEQACALAAMCREVRRLGCDVIAYSGFLREQLEAGVRPHSEELLGEIDVLIDGPFLADRSGRLALRGSSNQRVHRLTGRVAGEELRSAPVVEWAGTEGSAEISGFHLCQMDRLLRAARVAMEPDNGSTDG